MIVNDHYSQTSSIIQEYNLDVKRGFDYHLIQSTNLLNQPN